MATKLFVGGLSFSTNDDSLYDAFQKYGKVVEAKVVLDRDSHRSRGFGFVTFADATDAEAAIAGLSGAELDGRQIRVDSAKEGSRDSRPRGSYGGGGGRNDDRRGGYGGYDNDRRDSRPSGGGSRGSRDYGSSRRTPYEVSDSRAGGYSSSRDRDRDNGGRDRDRDNGGRDRKESGNWDSDL